MEKIPSAMKLHLRYRLYIAEMNLDINVLRIFDDYVKEMEVKKKDPEVNKGVRLFQKKFVDFRTEIDELRHEMHLQKMKLAALDRDNKTLDKKTYKADNHQDLKKRYKAYRESFDKLKKKFRLFEEEWLN